MAAKYHCIVPVYHSGTKKGSALGAVNMLISIGGVAIYAVRIGQGDVDGANDVFRHGILLQLCAAAVFSLAGIFFADGICSLLGANETFRHLAVDYLFWYSIFVVATVEKEQRIW